MSERERAVILATAGYDHTIKLWHAPSGTVQRSIPWGVDTQINCLQTTPDKQYLAAAGCHYFRLFDAHSNNTKEVRSFTGHTEKTNITAIGFQRDMKWLFSGGEDGTIKIWDCRAPNVQRDIQCKSPITSVVLHPNQGELISTDEDGSVRVWDLSANKCSMEVVPEEGVPCRSVSVSSDANMMCVGNNKGICFVWKLSSNRASALEPYQRVDASRTFTTKVKFSPNNKLLATACGDHLIRLWDVNNNYELVRTLKGHHGWVWDMDFSADSTYLVSVSSDKLARLWEMRSGEALLDYRGHTRGLTCVTLNDY